MRRIRFLQVAVLAVLTAAVTEIGAQIPTESPFTLALTGDAIITRPLSVYQEPEFLRMIELIRGADAAFTNLEMLFHDYEPYPMYESGGTYMRGDPALAAELVWAGFDLVSRANNHTGDYGVEGMRLTTRYVAQVGLVQAGVGESLEEAREARFLETARGRVALISVSSTFTEHSTAGASRAGITPRPGLNPLHYSSVSTITAEQMTRFRQLLRDMGRGGGGQGERLNVFGQTFVVGDSVGTATVAAPRDLEEIMAVIRSADRLADYVLVSLHGHESGRRGAPPDFHIAFARAAIEAGADMVVGHGPHSLRGIEIYQGKPILYSLGDFIFQNETLLRLPPENYDDYGLGPEAQVADFNAARYRNDTRGFPVQRPVWESVIAIPAWQEGRLVSLELHPITLGFGLPPARRGRPMPASAEDARRIIEELARLSEPMGTRITFRDGIGIVHLP